MKLILKQFLVFIVIAVGVVSISKSSCAQGPLLKQWDYRYGGNANDYISAFAETRDHGFIIGGSSTSSAGGDKSQNGFGGFDYWIVKIDSLGAFQWDKTFGGSAGDNLFALEQTNDGGYIIGGYSQSGISGNKNVALKGVMDYWIIKTDSSGNVQWQKDFGGSGVDLLYDLHQTSDKGYIMGGYSSSGISGDKTQALKGTQDYWVVKTDSMGNLMWEKDFGGTSVNALHSLRQTTDGGYILGGTSNSGVGGDKTQITVGLQDYWIVKIDAAGIKLWDADFGGTASDALWSLKETDDKGFILAGLSMSPAGGDKTQDTIGGQDYWMVKTDSAGNKIWDRDFGGAGDEQQLGNVIQTNDGGFMLSGLSASDAGGDKSEDNITPNQSWIVKTDALGIKEWDKTLLIDGKVDNGYAIQTAEGCYTIGNDNNGSVAYEKSQLSWNNSPDYWIVKFCDSTQSVPPIVLFTGPHHVCPGTCIDFTNLSTNATSYQWSFPGGSPAIDTALNPHVCYSAPGQYAVSLIAYNLSGSDTISLANYVTVYPFPPPQGIVQNGDTLYANAGAVSYQWYRNGLLINGATDYYYVASSVGDYNVVCADQNSCEVEAVIYNVVAGIASPNANFSLMKSIFVFPSPVTEILTVEIPEFEKDSPFFAKISDALGRNIIQVNFPKGNSIQIGMQAILPGIYFFELSCHGNTYRSKFTKE